MKTLKLKGFLTEGTKVVNGKPSIRSFDFPTMLFLLKQATSEYHGLIYSVSQQRSVLKA